MSETRKAILDKAVQQFGLEDNRTVFIYRLAGDYEDNDWNNKCMSTLLYAMIEMEN